MALASKQMCNSMLLPAPRTRQPLTNAGRTAEPFTTHRTACLHRRVAVMAAAADAEGEDDDNFDARLAKLRGVKSPPGGRNKNGDAKETPYSVLKERNEKQKSGKGRDWGPEEVFLETPPHRGELAVNLAFGATILWLPLTFAAIGRAAFVKYKFTDKRISVATTAPWKDDELNAGYDRVDSVISIGRGIGVWGDMVVNLKDGSKIEMRGLPKHKEVERYINERVKATRADAPPAAKKGKAKPGPSKGFGS